MSVKLKIPSSADLAKELGVAKPVWDEVMARVSERFAPIEQEWRPSKSSFGSICLLRQKKRTLLYMTPESGTMTVAIVLGERAVALALDSSIPESIKSLIREARKYAEGRGIRFRVENADDIATVSDLIAIKTKPT